MSRLIRLGDVLFFMLFYRLNTVICQVKVQAYVGDEVVLPCVYNEASPLPDAASVFWRDKDNYVVLNIKQGRPDYSSQNKKFKGRVFSEQDGNMKGNFSIVMKSVQEADHGMYECHVPKVSFQRGVSLTVSEPRVKVEAVTPRPSVGPSGGSTLATPNILHVLLPLLALTCSCFK